MKNTNPDNNQSHYYGVVREHCALSGGYRKMLVEVPALARRARAGQFVHVLPRNAAVTAPFLRRAFSIMSAEHGHIEIVYRVMGRGTRKMDEWLPGQSIDLLGPLGKPYPEPQHPVLLIGGGVGVPPLVMMATQTHRENPHLPITALIGARSSAEILGENLFADHDIAVRIATNDGSAGEHGLVTDILDSILQAGQTYSIYACGPLPMLRTVANICAMHDQRALLSMEENMPCGIGVCNGCALPVISDQGEYHQYIRICVDGPGLWSDQVDWSKMRN